MDIVTSLPSFINPILGKMCNIILVIVDRFSKYALYILTIMKLISSSLVELLFYYII